MGTQLPYHKKGGPNFLPMSIVPKRLNGSIRHLYGGRPWPKRHCVRWRPSSPPQKRGHSPQILAHVCCGQTAGWIKMPLGTKVGLGSGCIVLHGDIASPSHKGYSPQFSAHVYCGQMVAHLSYCWALVFHKYDTHTKCKTTEPTCLPPWMVR